MNSARSRPPNESLSPYLYARQRPLLRRCRTDRWCARLDSSYAAVISPVGMTLRRHVAFTTDANEPYQATRPVAIPM